jgi:hypothetical protein
VGAQHARDLSGPMGCNAPHYMEYLAIAAAPHRRCSAVGCSRFILGVVVRSAGAYIWVCEVGAKSLPGIGMFDPDAYLRESIEG